MPLVISRASIPLNSSIGRVECPIVKIVRGVISPGLWFRFPD